MSQEVMFKERDLVYVTKECVNQEVLMSMRTPRKLFEYGKAYVIKAIGMYGDGIPHVLVEGGSQFVHQKYFRYNQSETIDMVYDKLQTIKIDEVEYFLVPVPKK